MSPDFDIHAAWRRLRAGDEAAFYNLYKHFHSCLFHIGYRICGDPGLARDAIHDYFLYLWERRDNLPEVRFVTGYITIAYKRMLRDTVSNKQKKVGSGENPEEEIQALAPSHEEIFTDRESYSIRMKEVTQAIQNLPQRQQELILYRYSLGLSHQEIAEKTGLSLRSVYNQLNIALSRLKKVFAEKDGGASFLHMLLLL